MNKTGNGHTLKAQKDKLVSMKEAIGEAVRPGDSLVIEGFTHLICFAAGHEIIRQGIEGLHGIRLTPDLVYDQLIEAGAFKRLTFSWAGNPGVGSLHAFRRKTQASTPANQRLELDEYSHFGLLARFQAGAAGLPFWPLRNFVGTQIAEANPDGIKTIDCPFTDEQLAAVPAIRPGVGIIHVQRADRQGNAQVWGLMGTQKETAFASERVIVVAEEIVDESVLRNDPNRTLIPGILVDHVVHEPWGAHPSYAQGYYDRDNSFYIEWDKISRTPKTYADYLNDFVRGTRDRPAYRKKCESRLSALAAKPRVSEGVDYGY